MTLAKSISRSIWASERFPGGSGLWRGGLWASQRLAWTPAALFAQGQQGAWYEPLPQYLYQDSAGTTPVTADGQPVGYMQDLSGNGNHAIASAAANKPIYRTDGTLHWLSFDGVDDYLETSQQVVIPGASLLSLGVSLPEGAADRMVGSLESSEFQAKITSQGRWEFSLNNYIEGDGRIILYDVAPPRTAVVSWYRSEVKNKASITDRDSYHTTGHLVTGNTLTLQVGCRQGVSDFTAMDMFGLIFATGEHESSISQAQTYIGRMTP